MVGNYEQEQDWASRRTQRCHLLEAVDLWWLLELLGKLLVTEKGIRIVYWSEKF